MRGVNKLILEIKNPESEYFERAILFLKPESVSCTQSELNKSADRLLRAVMEQKSPRRRLLPLWVGLGLGLIVLGTVLLLVL